MAHPATALEGHKVGDGACSPDDSPTGQYQALEGHKVGDRACSPR